MTNDRALGYYQGMRFALALFEGRGSYQDAKKEVLEAMETLRKEHEEVKT